MRGQRRGTLGIYAQDMTEDLAAALGSGEMRGALVAEVREGSPAQQAGIRAGDVITSLAAYPVRNMQDFYNAEGQLPVGEKQQLELIRESEVMRANISVTEAREIDGAAIDRRLSGARFEEIPERHSAERIIGVVLTELDANSLLASKGFRSGDIITGINKQQVRDLVDLRELVQSNPGPFLLQVHRNGEDYIVKVD